MQKKTIKFSFYLILCSFLAKILSFISRILLARNLDPLAMSYYTILSPTIVILISFVQMGIPSVLSKLVAEKNYHFQVFSTSIYFTIFTTSLTTIIYLLFIPFLSSMLFKEKISSLFYMVLPFLPLVALSGLLKGYLMGRQKFLVSNFSQVIEEGSRILFLFLCFPFFSSLSSLSTAKIAVLSISVAEIFSALFMGINILLMNKRPQHSFPYSKETLKNILSVALPMSGSRIIGSISYFLEPIVMNISLNIIESKGMMLSYGILNGYVLPLLTMPSFISITLANYLLPSFTFHYSRGNQKQAIRLFLYTAYICLFVGCLYGFTLYLFSDQITQLLYHSTDASLFLKKCSIPFILYSLQPIFSSLLHATNHSKQSALDTLSGSIVRLSIVFFLSPKLKENALLLGLIMGMLVTTIFHFINLYKIRK